MSAARSAPNKAVQLGSVRGLDVVTRLYPQGEFMQDTSCLGCHHTAAAGDHDVWSDQ